MSIAIIGGKVFMDGLLDANILIDGTIQKITRQKIAGDEIINAKGCIILPGIIDAHVHFREPGMTQKEDFLTGSLAAAAGGITTVLDMPNNKPPTLTQRLLDEKREMAKKSIVNYGFHFGSSPTNLDEIQPPSTASTKVFFDQSTGNMGISDRDIIKKIFQKSRMITAHAEGENCKRALDLSHETKTPLSVCHISSAAELSYCREGKPLGVEVCPHHLLLSDQDQKTTFQLMKPLLKSKVDVAALWQGINDGTITHIASDHAPHTRKEKEEFNAPSGVPGVETMLPLMLDCANQGRLVLKDIVRLMSENPARIFRLAGKGQIAQGSTDLTIVDMNEERIVKTEDLHSKCGWTPYEGMKLKGWPTHTIVGGKLIYDKGHINRIPAREVTYA